MKKIVFSILFILVIISSILFLYVRWERHFSGYLVWDFETSVFLERSRGDELNYHHGDAEHQIWLGPSEVTKELYDEAPYTAIYDTNGSIDVVKILKVDFIGRLSLPMPAPPLGYGHLGLYPEQVEITKVNSYEIVKSAVDIKSLMPAEIQKCIGEDAIEAAEKALVEKFGKGYVESYKPLHIDDGQSESGKQVWFVTGTYKSDSDSVVERLGGFLAEISKDNCEVLNLKAIE